MPGGAEGSVAHIAGLFAEDRARVFPKVSVASLADSSTRMFSRTHGRADADHAAFIEVAKKQHLANVRNVARDFLGAGVCQSRASISYSSGCGSKCSEVVLTSFSLTRMAPCRRCTGVGTNATSTLRPSASSPRSRNGPSASTCPWRRGRPRGRAAFLVDAGVLVRTLEFDELVEVCARSRERTPEWSDSMHDDPLQPIWSTIPSRRQMTTAPESRAVTFHSRANEGASRESAGTVKGQDRFLNQPEARKLASSFSRNGTGHGRLTITPLR